jgi:SAM-dependent methyltransferase
MTSPWLAISADEYEAHMSASHVGQRDVLDDIFREMVLLLKPRRLLVAGCGPGGGWQHIDPTHTEVVTGIDLNPEYLRKLQAQHGARLRGLDLICGDITLLDTAHRTYDLIVAALLFEYIDIRKGLKRLSGMLHEQGALLAVLQLPSNSSDAVSETISLNIRQLTGIMKLIDPDEFEAAARSEGLFSNRRTVVPLPGGKAFLVLLLTKAEGCGG